MKIQHEDYFVSLERKLKEHCFKFRVEKEDVSNYLALFTIMKNLYNKLSSLGLEDQEIDLSMKKLDALKNNPVYRPLTNFLVDINLFIDNEMSKDDIPNTRIKGNITKMISIFMKDAADTFSENINRKYDRSTLKNIHYIYLDSSHEIISTYLCLTTDSNILTPLYDKYNVLRDSFYSQDYDNRRNNEYKNDPEYESRSKRNVEEVTNHDKYCKSLYRSDVYDNLIVPNNQIEENNGQYINMSDYAAYCPALIFIMGFITYLIMFFIKRRK